MKRLLQVLAPTLALSTFGMLPIANTNAADWAVTGTVLGPNGIIVDGAVSISGQTITAVGPSASIPNPASPIMVPGVIVPGFIDLHNHLT
jgi:imidazolonepropionase-like amidohydrolase